MDQSLRAHVIHQFKRLADTAIAGVALAVICGAGLLIMFAIVTAGLDPLWTAHGYMVAASLVYKVVVTISQHDKETQMERYGYAYVPSLLRGQVVGAVCGLLLYVLLAYCFYESPWPSCIWIGPVCSMFHLYGSVTTQPNYIIYT